MNPTWGRNYPIKVVEKQEWYDIAQQLRNRAGLS